MYESDITIQPRSAGGIVFTFGTYHRWFETLLDFLFLWSSVRRTLFVEMTNLGERTFYMWEILIQDSKNKLSSSFTSIFACLFISSYCTFISAGIYLDRPGRVRILWSAECESQILVITVPRVYWHHSKHRVCSLLSSWNLFSCWCLPRTDHGTGRS